MIIYHLVESIGIFLFFFGSLYGLLFKPTLILFLCFGFTIYPFGTPVTFLPYPPLPIDLLQCSTSYSLPPHLPSPDSPLFPVITCTTTPSSPLPLSRSRTALPSNPNNRVTSSTVVSTNSNTNNNVWNNNCVSRHGRLHCGHRCCHPRHLHRKRIRMPSNETRAVSPIRKVEPRRR